MVNYFLLLLVSMMICYLIGSINFAIILTKIVINDDVRNHGSGNAGMTNVIRTVSLKAGLITFVLDALKGVVSILLTKFLIIVPYYTAHSAEISEFFKPDYAAYYCAAACMLGHVFPLFFNFRGGKAVATAIGLLFCINWLAAIFVLLTFLILLAITKIISIGSVMGAVEWIFYAFIISADKGLVMQLYTTALAAILGAIVIIKHKDNIVRLHNGEEKAIKSKK